MCNNGMLLENRHVAEDYTRCGRGYARLLGSCLGWSGERYCRDCCWPRRLAAVWWIECTLGSLGLSLTESILSSVSTISCIGGLFLGSASRQVRASCATRSADLGGYLPSRRESMIFFSFLLSHKCGLIQSPRLCCPDGRFVSSARRPVSISTKTTPKPYTSLFTYKCPGR